jgi:hypothetical protein
VCSMGGREGLLEGLQAGRQGGRQAGGAGRTGQDKQGRAGQGKQAASQLARQLELALTVPGDGAVHVYSPEGDSGANSRTPPTLQLAGQSAAGVTATPPLQTAQCGWVGGKLSQGVLPCSTEVPARCDGPDGWYRQWGCSCSCSNTT